MALLVDDFRRPGIDVSAFADHSGEEVLVGQLRIRVGNGLARDPQLFGQQAAGRQLRPGCQATGFNGVAQLPVQLACQVLAAVDDNMKFHTGGAPGAVEATVRRARLPA
ncbi:hypothetical protein ABIA58_003185 [Pseudomonas frederiksbergensis]